MAFNWRKFPWTNLHDLNLDWIIQTVKTLENNLADAIGKFTEIVNTAITKTLTGAGDLTINKTGDVKISGRSVTIYPVKIPADIVDIGEYAANCGFVSMEVENMTTMLDNDIDTERTERLAGDAALQAAIASLQQKAIFNINTPVTDAFVSGTVTLNSTVISQLKTAISNNRFVSLTLSDNGASNDTLYLIINNHMKQISNPSEFKIYFKDIKGEHIADIDTATGVLTYREF